MAQACKISYIDDIDTTTVNITANEVSMLRDQHVQIAKEIYNAVDAAGEKLFQFVNGYLVLSPATTANRQAQDTFIRDLLSRLAPTVGPNVSLQNASQLPVYYTSAFVRDTTLPNDVVALNIFNTLSDTEKMNYFGTTTINLKDADLRTLVQLDPNEIAAMLKLGNEWGIEEGDHTEFFKRQAEKFSKALSIYLGSINKSSVGLPTPNIKLNKLYELGDALKTANDATATKAVHNYVFNSIKNLRSVIPLFSDQYTTEQDNIYYLLNDLDNSPSEAARVDTLRKIAKLLNDSTQYLHLFDNMKGFHAELRELGFKPNDVNFINTESPRFLSQMDNAVKSHITEGDYRALLEFFKDPQFTTTGLKDMIRTMVASNNPTSTYTDVANIISSVDTVLSANSKAESVDKMLAESMQEFNDLQADIKKFHTDLVFKAVFPIIERKQANRPQEHRLTAEAFRNQIGTAEVDEDFLKAWLDSAVKSQDALTANAANIVAEAYYEAHIQNIQDAVKLSDIADLLDIDKMSTEERDRYYEGMTHTIIEHAVDENHRLIEADQAWIDAGNPTIEVEVMGSRRIYRGNVPKSGFMTQKNTAKYAATKKAFDEEKARIVEDLYNGIVVTNPDLSLSFNWQYLQDAISANWTNPDGTPNWYWRQIYARFWKGYQETVKRKDFERDHIKIKSALSNALYTQFEKDNYEPLTQANLRSLYTTYNVDNLNTRFNVLPTGFNGLATGHDLRPQAADPDNETYRQWILLNIDNMMHKYDNNRTYVFMKKGGVFRWVDITDRNSLRPNTQGEVLQYFNLSRSLKVLAKDKYDIDRGGWGAESQRKWAALHADNRKSGYFRELFSMYSNGNNVIRNGALKHGILPQIKKIQQFSGPLGTGAGVWGKFTQWLSRAKAWGRNVLYHNNVAGTTGNPNQDVETKTRQYINGQPVLDVPFEHTSHIAENELERDLFRSVLAYKTAANNYSETSKIEPVMRVIRRVISGDLVLGLDERKAILRDNKGRKMLGAFNTQLRKNMPNLNQKLLEFIDDSVYGEGKIKDESERAQKIATQLTKYTSMVNLMWNMSAMATNLTVGNINNIIQAASGQYSTRKDNLEAALEYDKYLGTGKFIKDMIESNPAKKSMIGQLNLLFDSIQGEFSSEMVHGIARKGDVNKAWGRLTMWTQGGAEHQIQTQLMIQLMKGYKLPSGASLWDSKVEQPNRFISFTPEVTPEILKDFRLRLHAVNKNLHGQYSKLDKSMVSRRWWGKLLMMYKKYIYSSYRSRFQGETYDWEIGDSTQGYINAYYQKLLRDWKDENRSFGMKIWSTFNEGWLKPTAGIVDSLTGKAISSNWDVANRYFYEGLSDAEILGSKKYMTELAWFSMLSVVAVMAHAMTSDDDDDEVQNWLASSLEATATRAQGDIGMFLPFYNTFINKETSGTLTSFDKAQQTIKNPFAQMRTADNVSKLIGQGFEDALSFQFEQYERKGIGYEKGDYKIVRDIKKAFPYLSAYHHILQFMNPKEQLQYNSMIRDNSRSSKKKDSEKKDKE